MKRLFLIALLCSVPLRAVGGEPPFTASATQAAADLAEQHRLDTLARQYEQVEGKVEELDGKHEPVRAPDTPSLPILMVKMIFTLGAVCLLAYLLLGKLMPRMLNIQPPAAQRRIMQVIDRLPIDQRRSLLVIRIAEQYFLVGASEGGIHLISKLDADQVDGLMATVEAPKPVLGKWASLLLKKRE